MRAILYKGRLHSFKSFYANPQLPDERLYTKVPYNHLVALSLKGMGYTVVQELTMPIWGCCDIFAYKGKEVIVVECKSEKDRNITPAIGQIISYTSQLLDVGYEIQRTFIFTRTDASYYMAEPVIQKINKFLPFQITLKRVSNKTPLLTLENEQLALFPEGGREGNEGEGAWVEQAKEV